MKLNLLFRKSLIKKMEIKYLSTNSENNLKMPEFNYTHKHYEGLAYEVIDKIKSENIVPCIQQYYKKPLLLHEGKMQWLFDFEGKRYLDMFGGIVTVSVGHSHPKLLEAVKKQIDILWHCTNIYRHTKLYEYVSELLSTLPSHLKVVYIVNSGSEANDLAVFLARLHTGNFDIISFRNCYHGMSPYMMGVTALSTWRHNVPTSFGVHHAMNPDVYKGIWGGKHCRDCIVQTKRTCDCSLYSCSASENYYKQLEEVFKHSIPHGHIAGLIAESIQGIGGIIHFPKGFLRKAYELVRANEGICIADEVQTGFGRTGDHYWGFQMHGIKPDIVTMAKGIGNGFPLAAVVTTQNIANSLKHSSHFNTFGGNPLACSVGLKVLEIIKEEDLQYNSKTVGTKFIKELEKLKDEFECVGDVRGKGLMIGVELVKEGNSTDALGSNDFMSILEDCKDMGVLIGRGGLNGNVLRFSPPMCVTVEDVKFTVDVLRKSLKNFYRKKQKS